MQKLLEYCVDDARAGQEEEDDSDLCFEHVGLVPALASVRRSLVAVYKKVSTVSHRLDVEQLFDQCESVEPAVMFPGCGAIFDLYFVLLGPANMHRRMMQARKAGVSADFNALRRAIQNKLSSRFYYWLVSACRSISQRACTRQLFYLSLPTDFRGLSGEHDCMSCHSCYGYEFSELPSLLPLP